MPNQLNTINLIRTKTSSSPQLEAIELSLRKSGMYGLVAFLCIGVVLGLVYTLSSYQLQAYENEKEQLVSRINASKNKEGLLIAIKDRTKVVEKVVKNQKPWTKILDLVATFAQPPLLTNITADDQNKVTITVKSQSLDSVRTMIGIILDHTKNNQIKNPQIVSFQIAKKGGVELTISFFAIF
jgi:hypothetical protein